VQKVQHEAVGQPTESSCTNTCMSNHELGTLTQHNTDHCSSPEVFSFATACMQISKLRQVLSSMFPLQWVSWVPKLARSIPPAVATLLQQAAFMLQLARSCHAAQGWQAQD